VHEQTEEYINAAVRQQLFGFESLGQVVEGARAERGFPFERRLPPFEDAARATLRLFFGLSLHVSQNHTPSGATSSPIHPKWN
jgi:hypothetical protein